MNAPTDAFKAYSGFPAVASRVLVLKDQTTTYQFSSLSCPPFCMETVGTKVRSLFRSK